MPHPALASVRAILFDKDGTLLDFEATWGPATASVLAELSAGDEATGADLAASCGFLPASRSFAPDSPIIGGDMDDFAPRWAALLRETYDRVFIARVDELYRAASLACLTAYDDVAPTLKTLRNAGFPVGLATNDTEATARSHLDRLDIAPLFDFVAGYDSGFGPKPGPGMVNAFAEAVRMPTRAIALVGDSPHDMHAAKAAGAIPVGILRTPAAESAVGALPRFTVRNLADLVAALGLDA